ncbi:MAG: magnesium chelatase [Acidobacteriota bacterium]
MSADRPSTLGELRASGYRPRTVREEMRVNLRRKLAAGETLFPGVLGYDRTVVPGIVNAVLAGHDMILLGLRGQAKTRLLRSLTSLLDDEVPVLRGTELNDDPMAPVSVPGQKLVDSAGDDAPVDWLPRELRYNEKLATPDVSIADLLGDIDPIKAATRKLTYADPEVIHFGIIPRTNRGIFGINELPDLAPRIQVGLLNMLEERDLQIRGFPVRVPLDILLVFSANPEDYTNRGSIITPLKDRISSQILTHYPRDSKTSAAITAQEAWLDRDDDGPSVVIPEEVRLLVEEIAFAARESELVDQTSGVSARMAISALELLHSNLERRALVRGEDTVYPRLCDLHMLLPAITGKVEMVYEGEQQGAEVVAGKILGEAAKNVFVRRFPKIERSLGSGGEDDDGPYSESVAWFVAGGSVTLTDEQPFEEYRSQLEQVPGLMELAREYVADDAPAPVWAFTAELILEGLHQHLKLAREDLDSQVSYKEMVKFQLLRPKRSRRDDRDVN